MEFSCTAGLPIKRTIQGVMFSQVLVDGIDALRRFLSIQLRSLADLLLMSCTVHTKAERSIKFVDVGPAPHSPRSGCNADHACWSHIYQRAFQSRFRQRDCSALVVLYLLARSGVHHLVAF